MIVALALAALGCTEPKDADPLDTAVVDTGDSVEPDEPDPIDLLNEADLPAGVEPCRDPVLGVVTSVIDGDTIKVETGRGVESVRLIGIDTPEVDHSGPDDECYGEESKAFLYAMLHDKKVWLTFDSECDDYYDRTLSYVHTGLEDNGFIQRLMLQGGWAETLVVEPNVSFRTLFQSDQSVAQSEGVGLWGDCR